MSMKVTMTFVTLLGAFLIVFLTLSLKQSHFAFSERNVFVLAKNSGPLFDTGVNRVLVGGHDGLER